MHNELLELVEAELSDLVDSLQCHINGRSDEILHSPNVHTRKQAIAIVLSEYDDYASTGALQTGESSVLDSVRQRHPDGYGTMRDTLLLAIDDPDTRDGVLKILTMNQL